MMVTGDIYKPSDRRIKSNLEVVDGRSQLSRIRELTIYDYVVHNKRERGVIAQELERVIPEAVHTVGDTEFDGQNTIPNLLVINERMLLYENLGATKQLDKDLESEKENIVNITTQMDNITETSNNNTSYVQGKMQFMMDVLFREEIKKKISYSGIEEEFINFQFSVFRMGPARSLFLLGHFAHWLWILGALYLFSNIKTRRCLGFLSVISILFNMSWNFLFTHEYISRTIYDLYKYLSVINAGFVLILNYVRLKKTLRNEKIEEKQNREEDKLPPGRVKRCLKKIGAGYMTGYYL